MKLTLKLFVLFCLAFFTNGDSLFSQSSVSFGEKYALLIGGIGGQEEFTEKYFAQTSRMQRLLIEDLGYHPEKVIYLFEDTSLDSSIDSQSTAKNVRMAVNDLAQKMQAEDQLFVFLVGHGTYDGDWGKFNLVGPDLRDIDFAQLLSRLPSKNIVFVNTSSASGPFVKKMSGEKRVIITATKSGIEIHETNFADFFMDAFASGEADFNKDKRVSLLEAFKFAKTKQDNWYEENRRLRAEHPLLDDDGDGKGSEKLENASDGLWASRVYLEPVGSEVQQQIRQATSGTASPEDSLRLQKLKLEEQIADLKAQKNQLSPEEYSTKLETLLIQLAKTNQKLQDSP